MDGSNTEVILIPLFLDLQLFADPDKTEKATPRRRQKAREEGQISYSKDIEVAVVFLGILAFLRAFAENFYKGVEKMSIFFFSIPNLGEFDNYQTVEEYFRIEAIDLLYSLAFLLLAGFAVALVSGLLQTRFMFALSSLKFDLSRINPLSGFKRMFSLRSVIELIKNIGKLAVLGIIGWTFISGLWNTLFLLPEYSVLAALAMIGDSLYQMGMQIGFALLVLGFADFFYQRWEFERSIRMSKQEIKDEYKNIEGNPQIKAKQKQMMMEMARRRMMEEVPSATVVVTNPTHFAVALKFDIDTMSTPVVVAKGVDAVALRIIEIAQEYEVPIHENPPLARKLYENTEIGDDIPTELFHAVAQVLAFVLKAAGKV